jgi:hypothetical protein
VISNEKFIFVPVISHPYLHPFVKQTKAALTDMINDRINRIIFKVDLENKLDKIFAFFLSLVVFWLGFLVFENFRGSLGSSLCNKIA